MVALFVCYFTVQMYKLICCLTRFLVNACVCNVCFNKLTYLLYLLNVCMCVCKAAEKALKAAQFAVDAVTSFSHDLVTLAASLEDPELRRLAQKLQKIVGNSNKLYNPDPIDFVVIPHEEYSREMACDAVMCAVDVLERVKEFVELRDSS